MLLHLLMTTSSTDVDGAEQSLWLLERAGWQREESALLEALRIYTRDLRVAITFSMIPSEANSAEAQREVAQERCSSAVSLVAWFSGDSRMPVLNLFHCASQVADQLPSSPQNDLELSAQTLALKIRGLLAVKTTARTGLSADQKAAKPPRLPTQGADATLPFDEEASDGLGRVARRGSAAEELVKRAQQSGPSFTSSTLRDARTSQPSRRPSRRGDNLEIGLAYGLSSTANWQGRRQGASWRVALSFATRPLAVEADASWGTSVVGRATGNQTILRDVPVGLALSWRWETTRWLFSCGPRISLHLIQADGSSPDGRNGSVLSYSTGLGALEQVRYRLWGGISLQAALINEILVPRQRFTVGGQNTLQVGFLQWGLFVGAVYRFL